MRPTLRPTDWDSTCKAGDHCCRRFPKDTPKEHIIRQLRDIILPDAARGWRGEGVSDCFAPNFSSFGRIKFENSEFMWQFLKAFKGHRFMFNGKILFHSIDKTPAEMDLSRKVSRSLKRLRVCLVEGGLLREEAHRDDSADSWWPIGTLELSDSSEWMAPFIAYSSWTVGLACSRWATVPSPVV